MYGAFASKILSAIAGEHFFADFFNLLIIGLFVVMLAAFTIISVVLNHHWQNYGVKEAQVRKLRFVYFGISGVFIISMTVSFLIWLI